jgi:preprotein translocase subunit YajC
MALPVRIALLLQEAAEAVTPAVEAAESGAAPDGAPGPAGSPMPQWPMFVLMGLIFYFVLIRPESKRRKTQNEMLGALKKGDRVMTTSGMYGTVAQVQDDDRIVVQIADGVRVKFSRQAVQTVLTEGGEAAS